MHVSLHDHRVQGAVDPAAPLEQGGEERPRPQLRDLHLDITGGGRHGLRAVPVAVHGPLIGALVAAGADHRSELGFDQLLQGPPQKLGDHRLRISGLQLVEAGEHGRMVLGHRVVCPSVSHLAVTH